MDNPRCSLTLRGGALLAALLGVSLAGCDARRDFAAEGQSVHMADLDRMPLEVRQAPVAVQQAYQFAIANPAILSQIPCYCGCGAMGHDSNLACFASRVAADGVQFDSHALGCSICVDIAQDVMRLMRQGKDLDAIKVFVRARYSRYGPATGT